MPSSVGLHWLGVAGRAGAQRQDVDRVGLQQEGYGGIAAQQEAGGIRLDLVRRAKAVLVRGAGRREHDELRIRVVRDRAALQRQPDQLLAWAEVDYLDRQ